MHILDDEPNPTTSARHRAQQLRHRRKQSPPPPALIPTARQAWAAARTQPRQQPPYLPPHILRDGVQRCLHQCAAIQPGQLTQRRGDRQQRHGVGQRQALPPHRHYPRSGGPGHAFPGKPRLPHPRIPHHQHQPGTPAQRAQQARQLTLTTDKGHRPSHTPTPPAHTRQVNPTRPKSRKSSPGSPAGDSLLAAAKTADRQGCGSSAGSPQGTGSGRKLAITVEPLRELTASQRRQLDDEAGLVSAVTEATATLTVGP